MTNEMTRRSLLRDLGAATVGLSRLFLRAVLER